MQSTTTKGFVFSSLNLCINLFVYNNCIFFEGMEYVEGLI